MKNLRIFRRKKFATIYLNKIRLKIEEMIIDILVTKM